MRGLFESGWADTPRVDLVKASDPTAVEASELRWLALRLHAEPDRCEGESRPAAEPGGAVNKCPVCNVDLRECDDPLGSDRKACYCPECGTTTIEMQSTDASQDVITIVKRTHQTTAATDG
ncbi:MAG: hypothetical protein IIB56_10845 [Planctomycetes bacterium]|nr:hypothetical protein [Planctomycetota bacterium]